MVGAVVYNLFIRVEEREIWASPHYITYDHKKVEADSYVDQYCIIFLYYCLTLAIRQPTRSAHSSVTRVAIEGQPQYAHRTVLAHFLDVCLARHIGFIATFCFIMIFIVLILQNRVCYVLVMNSDQRLFEIVSTQCDIMSFPKMKFSCHL